MGQKLSPHANRNRQRENVETQSVEVVLEDMLDNSSLASRTGGEFHSQGGWQVTGKDDMLVYDLERYVESGTLEVHIRNFDPREQSTKQRHHFLSMFRNPWGSHHVVENSETVWDLHAGFKYRPGIKILSWTEDNIEHATTVLNTWNKSREYKNPDCLGQ